MTDDRERSKEFWFEFDNVFNPTFGHLSGDVMAAYTSLSAHNDGIDYPYQRWREHRKRGTYPDGFRAEMTSIQDLLLFLCAKQAEVLDRHFAGDPDAQRSAFEHFGEGVLFDQRRPVHQKVHQMDAALSPDSPPKGYYTWHGIIRAAVMVGADAGRWLAIDRNVGLAWGIHGEARPVQDAPTTPDCRRRVWSSFVPPGWPSASTSSTRPSTANHGLWASTGMRPVSGHRAILISSAPPGGQEMTNISPGRVRFCLCLVQSLKQTITQ